MSIFLILLTALILRLINLNQSLWLDEAINVVYSQKYSFFDFLTVYSLGDFHPPLYFGLLWIWTKIFGISEIAVRIPSVIFGILTVWLTYLTGKKLFNVKTGLVAALLLALNPLHVYYSQEARMYSLAAFAVTLSFWALINLLNGRRYFIAVYGVSVLIVLYSDYLAYLALVVQLFYVIWLERKKVHKFLLGALTGGFFLIPWLFIFPSQLKTGQTAAIQVPGWANVVGSASLKELGLLVVKSIIGRISFTNKYLYAAIVVPILCLYGLILYKALKNLSKETKLILLWIFLPVFLALLISLYIPIFAYFRMIFILPGLSILLAVGIERFNKQSQTMLVAILLIISLIFLLIYYINPKYQRENWKQAVNFVTTQEKPGRLVLFEDTNIPAPFGYYYPCQHGKCIPSQGGLKIFPAKTINDIAEFDEVLINSRNVIYLFDYLVEISDPNRFLSHKLEDLGFKLTNTYNFNGVGFVYEYSK